jgi:predicted amidohydrolase
MYLWQEAAANGAQLVVLPEMFNCPYSNDSFPSYAEDIEQGSSPSVDMLAQVAAACKIVLVAGSLPERSDGKLYNTCCVFGTDGKLLAKHRWVGPTALHVHDSFLPRPHGPTKPGNTALCSAPHVLCNPPFPLSVNCLTEGGSHTSPPRLAV